MRFQRNLSRDKRSESLQITSRISEEKRKIFVGFREGFSERLQRVILWTRQDFRMASILLPLTEFIGILRCQAFLARLE